MADQCNSTTCDMCGAANAVTYCHADSAALCGPCDETIHAANPLAMRHKRTALFQSSAPAPSACAHAEAPQPAEEIVTGHKYDETNADMGSLFLTFDETCFSGDEIPSDEGRPAKQQRFWVKEEDTSADCHSSDGSETLAAGAVDDFPPGILDLSRPGRRTGIALKLDYEDVMVAWNGPGWGTSTASAPIEIKCELEEATAGACGAGLKHPRSPFSRCDSILSDLTGGSAGSPCSTADGMAQAEGGSSTLPLRQESFTSAGGTGATQQQQQQQQQGATDASGSPAVATAAGDDGETMGREARVERYRQKRRNRLFSKKIRYQVRKFNAERRPRIKGRFVKRGGKGDTAVVAASTPTVGGSDEHGGEQDEADACSAGSPMGGGGSEAMIFEEEDDCVGADLGISGAGGGFAAALDFPVGVF